MKIHRLFLDEEIKEGEELILTNPQIIHQIRDVLRLKKEDSIILLDGSGREYSAKVKKVMKKNLIFMK